MSLQYIKYNEFLKNHNKNNKLTAPKKKMNKLYLYNIIYK